MNRLWMPLCLACLLASSCGKHYDVTFDALLDEMVSYEEAARLPAVPFTSQAGSVSSALSEEELSPLSAPAVSVSVLVRVRVVPPLSQVREEMVSVPRSGKPGMAARSSSSRDSRFSGRSVETV